MGVTYAVSWQEPNGSSGSGRLELGADALLLHGRNGHAGIDRAFPYRNMSSLRIGRGSDDRLQGRPTLIVDLAGGGALKIASVAQSGIVSELASRIAVLRHDRRAYERIAIVVSLKQGTAPDAAALLADGPPFDPEAIGLVAHEVFLTEREVVFVFEGIPTVLLARIAEDESIWDAAEGWERLVEGPVRYAERAYGWPEPDSSA
jgi:hypothetical protein